MANYNHHLFLIYEFIVKKAAAESLEIPGLIVSSLPPADCNALLRVLGGEIVGPPPFWLMRQAGRYLPEYRAVRSRAGSLLDLCYTPDLAAEVTLQPVRRFGMDAAILFSDILVVPHALGQVVTFREGEGPVLEPLEENGQGLAGLEIGRLPAALAPVYEALTIVRGELPKETAVIGFAGAPWTVAAYMIEGGTSRDFSRAKSWMYRSPGRFGALVDLLVEATVAHLAKQAEAGADALQLFDSWAGLLPEPAFTRWCVRPTARIVAGLRERGVEAPVIVFPRGAGVRYAGFAEATGAQGVSLDTTVPPSWARDTIPPGIALQGNLDPVLLLVGGRPMREAAEVLSETFAGRPFVFNLGHGVLPDTPVENVAELARLLRGGGA